MYTWLPVCLQWSVLGSVFSFSCYWLFESQPRSWGVWHRFDLWLFIQNIGRAPWVPFKNSNFKLSACVEHWFKAVIVSRYRHLGTFIRFPVPSGSESYSVFHIAFAVLFDKQPAVYNWMFTTLIESFYQSSDLQSDGSAVALNFRWHYVVLSLAMSNLVLPFLLYKCKWSSCSGNLI